MIVYVPKSPSKKLMITANPDMKLAIEFLEDNMEMSWLDLKREGWRIVRCQLTEIEE